MDNEQSLEILLTEGFASWLQAQELSLAFTTYQAGKIFLVGVGPDGRPSVVQRTFPRAMGFAASSDGRTLWLASQVQLWRFTDFPAGSGMLDGYDAIYVPIEGRTVGEVDIHDIHHRADAPPLFVVSRFNCIATLDDENSFAPLWMPPFVDAVVGEDRCHLNGMAIEHERPRYVTCVAATNVGGAWRDHRRGGGLVMDVPSGEVVASGMSMPHSPRLHNDRLYMLQSGTGEFGTLDVSNGRFTPICFLPGFARGMSLVGHFAIISVSEPRDERHFGGLPLQDRLVTHGQEPVCQVVIVNLDTGEIEHRLTLKGYVKELYDVAHLRGIRRPMIHGFVEPDLRSVVRTAPLDPSGPGAAFS